MQKHNLDYPEFYRKLYALFTPSLFHSRYLARFLRLSDLFLSSTYVPIPSVMLTKDTFPLLWLPRSLNAFPDYPCLLLHRASLQSYQWCTIY